MVLQSEQPGSLSGRFSATSSNRNEATDMDAVLRLLQRPKWQADAACRKHPDINWFPIRGGRYPRLDTAAAKRVCASCLVRPDCLEWALSFGPDLEGVWGGLSQTDRRRIRRHSST
jgi:WhiB family transcriptional regulator, redox-sensing transcriptional regulator